MGRAVDLELPPGASTEEGAEDGLHNVLAIQAAGEPAAEVLFCDPRQSVHGERKYSFCSEPCQWIFERAPDRYAGHHNLVERFLGGQITPMNLEGGLAYMGITPDVAGDDAHGYRWAADYRAASAPDAGAAGRAREG